jgi:hypothetical protein
MFDKFVDNTQKTSNSLISSYIPHKFFLFFLLFKIMCYVIGEYFNIFDFILNKLYF